MASNHPGNSTTVIPDGDNQTRTSAKEGERFTLAAGATTTVDGAPVLILDDDEASFTNDGLAQTTGDTATVVVSAEDNLVRNNLPGEIVAEGDGVRVDGEDARIVNEGLIRGDLNGVNFVNGGESSGTLVNRGRIKSDSRGVNIGGDDISVVNSGEIVGTDDQRNGTIYTDGTANDFHIFNDDSGVVDAGEGNAGAGIALQIGAEDGETVDGSVVNRGTINGRGQGDPTDGTAGDGIRLFAGADDVTFSGSIINGGEINSESTQGTVAGIRVANGISFDGRIVNQSEGVIQGANNGVYFGTGEHDAVVVNDGLISSDSRAVNIDGSGVSLRNSGEIIGNGDQRNGTVYADGTADDYRIFNSTTGVIDAGEGNNGAGIALEVGAEDGTTVDGVIVNRGTIDGRGQAAPTDGTAGDGIRLFAGADDVSFSGSIINSGEINSESTQGTVGGIRVANGVNFDGRIVNQSEGVIQGANNGVYFGTGEHDAVVVNNGLISSDSRAVNIDGSGVSLRNGGEIIGTGDQRNGTVYTDGTADDYSIFNGTNGVIDAGEGNKGAGIALEVGAEDGATVSASITNRGTIDGRGQADQTAGTAGDGIRLFAGADDVTFSGSIINSGEISSESTQGTVAGVRVANGVNFDGRIVNQSEGVIQGANNGVYFGTGEHVAVVVNNGLISSDSRAVNIDGSGVSLRNGGEIIGTGDQRNGTVYADSTADEYSIFNGTNGLIDAGEGNNGSAVSLQTGDVDGDVVSASLTNRGTIVGRGDATSGNAIGDGVRVFSDVEDAQIEGGFFNFGSIIASTDSDEAVGLRIEDGITFDGRIVNNGLITANTVSVDATDAGGSVTFVNRGELVGEARLSDGGDTFIGSESAFATVVDGRGGNDDIRTGSADDELTGGLGDDTLDGSDGSDTARFDDVDVAVVVDLEEGEATRETGFSVSLEDQPLASLSTGQTAQELVDQALANSLYFNVHTTDFAGGEIRGQLIVASDTTQSGVRTIVLEASLDSAQEPNNTSDSGATGTGTVTIVVDGGSITYSADLSVDGISVNDLLPVAGFSAVHVHNAPAGANGPVITDIIQDAGGDINGNALSGEFDTGDGDVFVEVSETDVLRNVENVVGSNDGDVISGTSASNTIDGLDGNDLLIGRGGGDVINGGDGDDIIQGGGGIDSLDGGAGNDTNSFVDINAQVIADLGSGSASYVAGSGATVFESFSDFENLSGSQQNDQLFGDGAGNVLDGNDGNDLLVGRGGDDSLNGGEGNDILRGGGGNDALDGGEGIDTADFSDIGVSLTANLASGTANYLVGGNAIADSLANIENLTGSANADVLIGDGEANLIAGGAGADLLIGGGGDDTLRGDAIGDGEAITVTITNTLGEGGTFLTPVWFGFHDGAEFDLFDIGAEASVGLERLAEDGSVEGVAAEFNATAGENGIDATLIGPSGVPGPIDPGETATFTINVNAADVGQGFFTWATMVIPSNDAFVAVPDDALADPIFDEDGNFLGPVTIERFGSDVLDAGTEVNDEEGAAFLNQTARDQGTEEGGVVGQHPGFNGSDGNPNATPVNILGGTTAPGAIIDPEVGDFTRDGGTQQLLEIVIDQLAGSADQLIGGAGNDLIDGGRGDDTLEGGVGEDTFVFGLASGVDTITDFEVGIDQIDVTALGVQVFSDLEASITDVDGNAVVDLGDSNLITLENIGADQLSGDDFLI